MAQAEIPVETIAAAAAFERAEGHRFVLNLAPYLDLPEEVVAAADPLVVNQGEGTALARSRCGLDATAEPSPEELCRLVARTCRSVVVTLGARGAAAFSGEEYVEVRPPAVGDVVDTTGAGDAFVGALAAGLARVDPLKVALAAATEFSARTVTRRGASSSYTATGSPE